MAFGFKPKGSRDINPEHATLDRKFDQVTKKDAHPARVTKPGEETVYKVPGSRHVPKDQMGN